MGTKDILKDTFQEMTNLLLPIGIQPTIIKNMFLLISEHVLAIKTNEHTIKNHQQSPNYVGFWENDLLLKLRGLLAEQLSTDSAISLVYKTSTIFINNAMKIYYRFINNHETFTKYLGTEEAEWLKTAGSALPDIATSNME